MLAATATDGSLTVTERPDPEPGVGEVLVRVHAAGLNNADLMQVAGHYPAPPGSPPDILGLELSGEVVACGPAATRFSPGDRVMAVVGGGGQAELCTVHERQLVPVPDGLEEEQAGGFPEVFTTAHDALFTQCGLAVGESVLVSGGAGGVGTAGIQLAVAAGCRVVASVRNEAMRAAVGALGATVVAPGGEGDEGPFDVILELIGGPNLAGDLAALATGGRVVVIGVGGGATTEVNLLALMGKRARLMGSTLRARPLEGKAAAARAIERHVLPLLADGRVTVPVAARFALRDAPAAYERFRAGGKLGKVVLTL